MVTIISYFIRYACALWRRRVIHHANKRGFILQEEDWRLILDNFCYLSTLSSWARDGFFFANRFSLLEALLTSPHGLSYAHFLITGCIVAVTCPIDTTITGTVLTGVTRLSFCWSVPGNAVHLVAYKNSMNISPDTGTQAIVEDTVQLSYHSLTE